MEFEQYCWASAGNSPQSGNLIDHNLIDDLFFGSGGQFSPQPQNNSNNRFVFVHKHLSNLPSGDRYSPYPWEKNSSNRKFLYALLYNQGFITSVVSVFPNRNEVFLGTLKNIGVFFSSTVKIWKTTKWSEEGFLAKLLKRKMKGSVASLWPNSPTGLVTKTISLQ